MPGGVMTRSAPWLAWSAACAAVALSLAATGVGSGSEQMQWKLVVLPVFFALPGAMIAAGRPDVPVGWLMLVTAVLLGGAAFGAEWVTTPDRPGADWAIWWTDRFSAYAVPCVLLVLLLLPDGRLPSRAWRPLVTGIVAAQVLLVTAYALASGPASGQDTSFPAEVRDVPNPVGVLPARLDDVAAALEPWLLQAPLLVVLAAIAVRLRRGDADERLRLGEVLLAAGTFVILSVLGHSLWPAAADVLDVVGGVLLGVSITVAVLRRRLGRLDVVLHHSFVYAVLTAIIALGYVAAVAVLSDLGVDLPPFGEGVLTAAIALAMLPIRGLLQRAVGTALYGDRRNPYAAVRRLDAQLSRSTTLADVLDGIARTTTSALRVPWAAVEVDGRWAEHGVRPAGVTPTVLSMTPSAGHPMTMSIACPRGRRLTGEDESLLEDLARQGGRTVTALLLAEALMSNRQLLVSAREEERSRLRLGSARRARAHARRLGDAAQRAPGYVLASDPATAAERLGRLEAATRDALDTDAAA